MSESKKRVIASECLEKIGQEVVLKGWVVTVRSHGKIAFFDLRDRSGIIQIGCFGELTGKIDHLGSQDVVEVYGLVKAREEKYLNKEQPLGSIEIEAHEVEIMQKASEMPFDMGGKDLKLELPTLLDYRTLTLRHPTVFPIFKVQEAIVDGFRKAAKKLDCTEVFVPTISYSSTEGGAEVFQVDYFDHKTFLIQSPQLYKQMMVPVFERVYLLSHAYRAEPSVTTYHLTESTQLDCEFGFLEFEELLGAFEFVAYEMIKHVSEKYPSIFKQFGVEAPKVSSKVPRITFKDALELIHKRTGRDIKNEKDLSREDEKDLSQWALEEHGSDLLTVTHFPTEKRAFYTMPDPKDPVHSLSYDMLFRGIEIMSGAKRIHNYVELVQTIKKKGMEVSSFAMYLQAFKYGMPPHGGFSFGLERLTMTLLNLPNIREASLFPRDLERVDVRLSKKEEKASAHAPTNTLS